MKTLKLVSKKGNQHFLFGEPSCDGQEVRAKFNSAQEMFDFFQDRINQMYFPCSKIIQKEYRMSRTYYSYCNFMNIENCTKLFNKLAK